MSFKNVSRLVVVVALLAAGIWLLSRVGGPAPETAVRQSAIQAFAPVSAERAPVATAPTALNPVAPVVVDLQDIPAEVYDPNNQFDRWQRGEIDLDERDGMRGAAELAEMRAASLALAPSKNISLASSGPGLQAPTTGTNFDSLDYTECCGGGGNVPPDPELAVGPNHVIAVVNVAFEIYDKNGNSLVGPTTFASFMNSDPNCTGVFDPNAVYDEQADRYVLGIDADGTHYCLAVSQSGNPTGTWNIYSFQTGSNRDFFDYPHAGIGNDAIYMGANIFRCGGGPFGGCSFKEARVWAFDKAAMYANLPAAAVSVGLGNQPDTPQPLNLHGWAQGTWPTGGPHYFFANATFDGANYNVYSWNDPFGANNFSTVGTVNLVTATGVPAGMPVDVPQLGGQTLQGNDFRPQDFEYRDGYGWSTQTIACNPGGGTVNCVRWAKIDLANATVADAGVYASSGEYRTFADLAVDACGNMAVGYTKSSQSMYPGVFVTGRLATEPAGSLQAETLLKAGEIAYTSFETAAPRRWGDYTEMTISPDGQTFWYLGEYSKNTGTTSGRWGTYIGSFSYGCTPGTGDNPPSVTITNPPQGATLSGTINVTATASDDNGVTQVEFFVDGASIGVDANGADGWSASWDTTAVSDGGHTISATATDTIGQTGSDANTVTVSNNTQSGTVHIGDLDGSVTTIGRNKWRAVVTITVHDAADQPVANATVSGTWSGDAAGTASCTTDGSGTCELNSGNLNNSGATTVTFTVDNISSAGNTYAPGANHDPDTDSDGTAITISR